MEWRVRIIGEIFDLKNLSKSLNSPELCITKIGQDYFLKSTDFNSLEKDKDVQKKADKILSRINGTAWLFLDMRKPLSSSSIVLVNDDGKIISQNVLLSASVKAQSRVMARLTKEGEVQETYQADPIQKCIFTAKDSVNVDKVLRLLGDRPKNWANFYSILEVVEDDIGGIKEIAKKGWASRNAIELFKYTANSFMAIGYDARHIDDKEPPEKQMTPSKAESLIRNVICNWIQSKK